MSHYHWLRENLEPFLRAVGVDEANGNNGLIAAHGDKCYGYKSKWEEANIPFEHGVAIYLLSYIHPYGHEVRETSEGWVDVCQWVIDNYARFKPHLPDPWTMKAYVTLVSIEDPDQTRETLIEGANRYHCVGRAFQALVGHNCLETWKVLDVEIVE